MVGTSFIFLNLLKFDANMLFKLLLIYANEPTSQRLCRTFLRIWTSTGYPIPSLLQKVSFYSKYHLGFCYSGFSKYLTTCDMIFKQNGQNL